MAKCPKCGGGFGFGMSVTTCPICGTYITLSAGSKKGSIQIKQGPTPKGFLEKRKFTKHKKKANH